MNVKISILLCSASLLCFQCEEKEDPVPLPVADFEMDQPVYEEGDLIQFTNTSQHAVRYEWLFGTNEYSNQENPVYDPGDFPGFGRQFSVKLIAYNHLGQKDSLVKYCIVSRRVMFDMHILEMSESFRQAIPQVEGRDTKLIIFTGSLGDPLEWVVPEQTYAAKNFSRDQELPYRFWYGSWTSYAMGNESWFFRISFQTDGPEDRVTLKQFVFNPIEKPSFPHPLNPEGLKYFILEDPDIKVEIIFKHITPVVPG